MTYTYLAKKWQIASFWIFGLAMLAKKNPTFFWGYSPCPSSESVWEFGPAISIWQVFSKTGKSKCPKTCQFRKFLQSLVVSLKTALKQSRLSSPLRSLDANAPQGLLVGSLHRRSQESAVGSTHTTLALCISNKHIDRLSAARMKRLPCRNSCLTQTGWLLYIYCAVSGYLCDSGVIFVVQLVYRTQWSAKISQGIHYVELRMM